MVCRQASNIGYPAPNADYLTWQVANDNRRPWTIPEWLTNACGMAGCCVAQMIWSGYLLWQMQS